MRNSFYRMDADSMMHHLKHNRSTNSNTIDWVSLEAKLTRLQQLLRESGYIDATPLER